MSSVYVVSEAGWEYNDEYFYRGECSGGTPMKAFPVEKQALTYCHYKNRDSLRGRDLAQYGYDSNDICDRHTAPEELVAKFNELFGTKHREIEYPFKIPEDATDEQLEELIHMLSEDILDFEVTEVELED